MALRENRISYLFFITLVCITLIAFSGPVRAEPAGKDAPPSKEIKQQANPYASAELTIKILSSVNNTFGYDILLYGRPMIHQPSIPGLSGNEGFKTKERSQKAADYVVKKLRNNEMPPTVTIEELNNLGVLK